jgi:dipeptidase
MADARRELLVLETRRHEDQSAELATVEKALAGRRAQAQQRVESEDMAREVLDRLNQPSAAQAASRLAEVIMNQRRG